MTDILSLFRRKTTYIYTAVLTVIITVIIMFYSFYNYYNEVINAHFANKGYTYLISHNDYTEEIEQYDDILSITAAVLFKVNFEDKFMGLTPSVNNGTEQDDLEEIYHRLFNWDYLINGGYDNILVFEYDKKLKSNEVILLQMSIDQTDEEIEQIKENEFTIYSNNELITLKIRDIEQGNYNGIKISQELYEELLKKQTINAKLIKFDNYNSSEKFCKDFYKRENSKDFVASSFVSYNLDSDDMDNMASNFKNIIDSCNTASIFLIGIFTILFVIVVKNSLIDQKKNIEMKRFLGYKKFSIKIGLIVNFILMSIVSYIISYILSSILIIISNNILNYAVQIIDLLFLIKLAGSTTVLSIILILIFGINTRNE